MFNTEAEVLLLQRKSHDILRVRIVDKFEVLSRLLLCIMLPPCGDGAVSMISLLALHIISYGLVSSAVAVSVHVQIRGELCGYNVYILTTLSCSVSRNVSCIRGKRVTLRLWFAV